MTYEPTVAVIAHGQKHIEVGRTTFNYDPSRFLLASIDLPVVSGVIEAREEATCLGVVAQTRNPCGPGASQLGRVQVPEVPLYSPAMATDETTVELLGACCRLVDLLDTRRRFPFSLA
jgi:hypothetical protein